MLLVHLDLSDVGGVVGRVDLVLLLVVDLTIQTLRRRTHRRLKRGSPSTARDSSRVLSYFIIDLVRLP